MEGKKTVDVVTSQRVAGSLALLESGQSSDMVIQCGSDEYHVHRSIVCPRSGIFNRMMEGSFIVSLSRRLVARTTGSLGLQRNQS